jgi:hypothetical protein
MTFRTASGMADNNVACSRAIVGYHAVRTRLSASFHDGYGWLSVMDINSVIAAALWLGKALKRRQRRLQQTGIRVSWWLTSACLAVTYDAATAAAIDALTPCRTSFTILPCFV